MRLRIISGLMTTVLRKWERTEAGLGSAGFVCEEEDEIDDEEENDGGFEPEHEPVIAVLLEEFVEAVERAEFFVT